MLIQALCYEFYSRVQAFVYEIGGIFMSKSLYSVEQRLAFINDCYTSGLSVYAWCKEKQIAPGTFYSWIHYLKKQGCTLPEVVPINLREKPVREPREIVKVNIINKTIVSTNVINVIPLLFFIFYPFLYYKRHSIKVP